MQKHAYAVFTPSPMSNVLINFTLRRPMTGGVAVRDRAANRVSDKAFELVFVNPQPAAVSPIVKLPDVNALEGVT